MWWHSRRENYKKKALLYWTPPAKLQNKEDIMDLRSIWKNDDERTVRNWEEKYQSRTCKRRRRRLRVWSWRSLWRACHRRNRHGWREDRRRGAWDSATNLTVWETWRKGIGEGRVRIGFCDWVGVWRRIRGSERRWMREGLESDPVPKATCESRLHDLVNSTLRSQTASTTLQVLFPNYSFKEKKYISN